MPRIVWRDRMAIGVVEIDDDHRRLVDYVNALEEAVNAVRFDQRAVAACLQGLVEYAGRHFAMEERLMRAIGFPHLTEHQRRHREGHQELLRLQRAFEALPVQDTGAQVYRFAANWLVKHVIMTDKEIAAHLPRRAAQ
ncbi:MAG TPA: bacteriohemerythrin [Azospirillum sp.]|nr:bacteriohemerythrin [Azospirillum sp.]